MLRNRISKSVTTSFPDFIRIRKLKHELIIHTWGNCDDVNRDASCPIMVGDLRISFNSAVA